MIDAIRVRLVPGKNEKYAMFPHGFARLTIPEQGDTEPVEIAIRKGVKLEARIVGPDGSPVTQFGAYCPGLSGQLNRTQHLGVQYEGDHFIANGVDPARTYRVMFTEGSRGLGAFASLKFDPTRTVPPEVKLAPLARIHGKVVGPTGAPITTAQIYARMVVTGNQGPFNRQELFSNTEIYTNLLASESRGGLFDRGAPNSTGEFVLDMLMPGARLYLTAATGDRAATVPIPDLKPGEDRDMGTITLHPEEL